MEQRAAEGRGTLVARPQPVLPRARVVRRQDFTEDLWAIWLEPEIPFIFKPGQYCTIGLEGIERAYSIVSAPHEPLLELFIELVPHGELTPRLHRLPVGETVTIRPSAKGVFTLDWRHQRHLMVATVTGIVPFVSILRDYLHRNGAGHRFYVLHGASYQDELVYGDELAALAQAQPETLAYVSAVSRPQEARNAGWQGETGRINTLVAKYVEEFRLRRDTTLIYACGHPGMIEALKSEFRPKGFRVKEERFWKE